MTPNTLIVILSVLVIVLTFTTGFLLGYIVGRNKEEDPFQKLRNEYVRHTLKEDTPKESTPKARGQK
jgi:uncharacterized protein YneF (UPF0154 family)